MVPHICGLNVVGMRDCESVSLHNRQRFFSIQLSRRRPRNRLLACVVIVETATVDPNASRFQDPRGLLHVRINISGSVQEKGCHNRIEFAIGYAAGVFEELVAVNG